MTEFLDILAKAVLYLFGGAVLGISLFSLCWVGSKEPLALVSALGAVLALFAIVWAFSRVGGV